MYSQKIEVGIDFGNSQAAAKALEKALRDIEAAAKAAASQSINVGGRGVGGIGGGGFGGGGSRSGIHTLPGGQFGQFGYLVGDLMQTTGSLGQKMMAATNNIQFMTAAMGPWGIAAGVAATGLAAAYMAYERSGKEAEEAAKKVDAHAEAMKKQADTIKKMEEMKSPVATDEAKERIDRLEALGGQQDQLVNAVLGGMDAGGLENLQRRRDLLQREMNRVASRGLEPSDEQKQQMEELNAAIDKMVANRLTEAKAVVAKALIEGDKGAFDRIRKLAKDRPELLTPEQRFMIEEASPETIAGERAFDAGIEKVKEASQARQEKRRADLDKINKKRASFGQKPMTMEEYLQQLNADPFEGMDEDAFQGMGGLPVNKKGGRIGVPPERLGDMGLNQGAFAGMPGDPIDQLTKGLKGVFFNQSVRDQAIRQMMQRIEYLNRVVADYNRQASMTGQPMINVEQAAAMGF